jgi:hypothetical protein
LDKRLGWVGDEDAYLDDLDALPRDEDHCEECGAPLSLVGPGERECVPCAIKEVRGCAKNGSSS